MRRNIIYDKSARNGRSILYLAPDTSRDGTLQGPHCEMLRVGLFNLRYGEHMVALLRNRRKREVRKNNL